VSLGAVSQAMAVVPYEAAGQRRSLDPSQQRRQAQRAAVHLREKSLVGRSLVDPSLVDQSVVDQLAANPILAVDLASGPTLPAEALVDLPTAVLLDRTHHHNLHHQEFAMLVRLARIRHILHNYVEPREWALCERKTATGCQAGRSITRRVTHVNHLELVLVWLFPSFAPWGIEMTVG
jgi:hypothetical protein